VKWGYVTISLLILLKLCVNEFFPWIYMTTNIKAWDQKTRLMNIHIWYQWSCSDFWFHQFPYGKYSTTTNIVKAVWKYFFHLSRCSKLWKHRRIFLSKTNYSIKGFFGRCTQCARLYSATPVSKRRPIEIQKREMKMLSQWFYSLILYQSRMMNVSK